MNLDLEGRIVTLAVAQRAFDKESESGVVNSFSTLIPVLFEDGEPAERMQFPANGDVWWMVRGGVRGLVEPGRLVTGELEASERADTPGKARYQVRIDSVEAARSTQITEILELQPDELADARDLVSRNHPLTVDHPPLDVVYVRWRGQLFGPLRTTASARADDGYWTVHLSPSQADSAVLQVPDGALGQLDPLRVHHPEVDVSLTNRPPYQSYRTHLCRYFLIPREEFQKIIPVTAARLVLENEQAILNRAAKKLFSRKKRQELSHLLTELDGGLGAAPVESTDVIRALRGRLGTEEKEAEGLARALLESGAVDDRLRLAVHQAEQEHVEKHAALLQTQIEESVAALRKELVALEKRKEAANDEIGALQRQRLAALDGELEAKRRDFDLLCQKERDKLDGQARELDRQRDILSKNLAKVSAEMAEKRDELVNQFLAISPLLSQLNLFAGPPPREASPNSTAPAASAGPANRAGPEESPARLAGPTFALPPFVHAGAPGRDVREVGLFERFCKHVEASGFKHRRLDLAAFHLSVKCNDLTILGGLPGTGKSSLPRLYAEALAGDEYDDGQRRYLHVGVSPSWLDMRDVLGHTNALDRCFQPAESGLYQHLVCAGRGAAARHRLAALLCLPRRDEPGAGGALFQRVYPGPGTATGSARGPLLLARAGVPVRPVCRLADAEIAADPAFHRHGQLRRDDAATEPTRARPGQPDPPAPAAPPGRQGPGPNASHWARRHSAQLPRLDRPLAAPRSVVGRADRPAQGAVDAPGLSAQSASLQRHPQVRGHAPPEVLKPEQALDLQIAQRVLPQVRNLFRPGAPEALEAIKKTLEAHPSGFPESLLSLEEMGDSDYPADLLAEGPGE